MNNGFNLVNKSALAFKKVSGDVMYDIVTNIL